MRTQNGKQKVFLGMRHSLLSQFFIFLAWVLSLYCQEYVCMYVCVCVCIYIYIYIYICNIYYIYNIYNTYIYIYIYTHILDNIETINELVFLPNNPASETLLHRSGAVGSVDWVFVIQVSAWRWSGEYVILDKTFDNLLFKQKVVAAPVTATFSSLWHSSIRPVLEI